MQPAMVDKDPSGRVILRLRGEHDAATAAEVMWQGLAALDAGSEDLIVDLSELTFLDTTVIGALITIRKTALAQGRGVIVRDPQSGVRRIFEITGLLETFGIDAP
jgi:anti-sigma B factor antagonist